MNEQHRLLVGAVNYLNSKPLVYQFERFCPRAQLRFDLPSRLADRLAAGEFDLALIPSIELFRNPTYTIVSDACIACRGPVLSVKLFSRVPTRQIRVLALDEGSRTSVALVRILLCERYGLVPRLEPLSIGSTLDDCHADAVLLIGDRAIHSPPGNFCDVWDLGDEWFRLTGLPFVFAMWVARDADAVEGLDDALGKARDAGVAHIDEIAAHEAPGLGLTRPECRSYLRDNLHFVLGDLECQALEMFYRRSVDLRLVEPGWEILRAEAVSHGRAKGPRKKNFGKSGAGLSF